MTQKHVEATLLPKTDAFVQRLSILQQLSLGQLTMSGISNGSTSITPTWW